MPWPTYSEFKTTALEWVAKLKQFEKIMLGAVLTATIILAIVVIIKSSHRASPPNICQTPVCLEEAGRIKQSILSAVDPCENIYQYSCGNFWERADEYEQTHLDEVRKDMISEIANQRVLKTDHKVLKLAKKFYQACMNDIKIEEDHLTTIKQVLNDLGGWPALEGEDWDEEKFDWVNTTYKIREMGYYYSIFLLLRLEYDPNVSNKKILQVATADVYSYHFNFFNWNVSDVAITVLQIFGAKNTDLLNRDIKDVFEFVEKLQLVEIPYYHTNIHNTYSIQEYQQKVGGIDWLAYLNKITGPGVKLSKHELALFAPVNTMSDWLEVIAKTPKRVIANYMLWKVVAEAIPYLHCEMRIGLTITRNEKPREDFCMEETVQRFNQNPFSIIAARKYLPVEKREKVEELVLNMKSILLELIKKADWMENKDKRRAIESIEYLTLWIGEPVNYWEDKALDDLVIDWVENNYNETFLSLVAQAERNFRSMVFHQLKIPVSESLHDKMFNDYAIPSYLPERHTFYIPFVAAQRMFFNEERPNYLNYATFGSLVGYQFARLITSLQDDWSHKTRMGFENKVECMEKAMDDFLDKADEVRWDSSQTVFLTQKAAAEQLAHATYQTWLQKHGEEPLLIGSNFTADQLFWISSASAWCRPYLPLDSSKASKSDPNFVVKLLGVSIGNENTFAKDFNCKVGTRMNPTTRCKIF